MTQSLIFVAKTNFNEPPCKSLNFWHFILGYIHHLLENILCLRISLTRRDSHTCTLIMPLLGHSGQQAEKWVPHIAVKLLIFFVGSYFNKPGNKISYSVIMVFYSMIVIFSSI